MHPQRKHAPLLVFSDDWGRHPSSAQHLIRQLLTHREVLWVNTIGTRPISFDLRTARRALEKLGHWLAPGPKHQGLEGAPESSGDPANRDAPRVISPLMWPSFSTQLGRSLNRHLLQTSINSAIRTLSDQPVAITTIPIVADLVGRLPVARWVYYCVDDFGSWPGYDGALMREMERKLLPKMDHTIAVSSTLVNHLRQLGADPVLLTHGVDQKFWVQSKDPEQRPSILEGLQGPLILFWGLIDRRMDVEWLSQLATALESRQIPGEIVLMGPQDDPDPALMSLPRIKILKAASFDQLPAIASWASVLVMPYREIEATRAMQPLKLKEYLATGRPVVVRQLPSTIEWADACDVCSSPTQFVNQVLQRLSGITPEEQQASRSRLAAEDWSTKAKALEHALDS